MANLSRSAASSTRNKQRPLLWVAMIFMTSAWAFARSRSRHELCLHDRAMSCVRAALAHGARVPCCVLLRHCKGASTCVLLLFMSRGRAVPLHKRRAFSVPRLYSSGAPLHCRAFTSAARLYSAAFTAAARLYSSTPLQQQCAFAVPCVYSSCRLYSGARLQQRHAFTVPRVNSIGAPLQCRAFTVAARLCSATRLQLRCAEKVGRSTPDLPARNRANLRAHARRPLLVRGLVRRTPKPRQHARGHRPEGGPIRQTAAAQLSCSWALVVGPSRALARHSPSSRVRARPNRLGGAAS